MLRNRTAMAASAFERLQPTVALPEPALSEATRPTGETTELGSLPPRATHHLVGAARPSSARPREPETKSIGSRFVLIELLGEGAMGFVYRAYDTCVGREVALKVLRQGRRGLSERLLHEARAMAALSDANVVQIYDASIIDGQAVLAMQYVAGVTLESWLQTRREQHEVLQAFWQAGCGLAAAHRVGLVHCDFKPANVLVGDDRVMVTDFGIAQSCRDVDVAAGIGTPWYMAPEQHLGLDVDPRTDQYALCVALWEALLGDGPFDTSPEALPLLEQKLRGPPRWPIDAKVPRRVVDAISRGLMPDRDQRFAAMKELLEALRPNRIPRGRRTVFASAALSTSILSGAGTWAWQAERAELCSGGDEQLRGTWNRDRREHIRSAMVGTGAGYAPGTATRVVAMLDDYATRWAQSHRAVCQATVDGLQSERDMDLRMLCLHRHRVHLDAVAGVLAAADVEMVAKAVDTAVSLPPLSRCDDVLALETSRPPAHTPRDALKVEQARALLAEARALDHAGKFDQAQSKLEAAQRELVGVDDAVTALDVALRAGQVQTHQGRHVMAEASLAEALELALSVGTPDDTAAVAAALSFVVGYVGGRVDEGVVLAELALASASEQRPDLVAEGHNSLGAMFHAQGRFLHAEAEFRETIRLRTQTFGPEHHLVAAAVNNLGNTLVLLRRQDEADKVLRQSLALQEQALGDDHPRVAEARNNLAINLRALGRYDEGEVLHRQALAFHEQALGPRHPHTITTRRYLAELAHDRGQYEVAEREHRHALELWGSTLGFDHPQAAMERTGIARALADLGRHDEAEVELLRAIPVLQKTFGSEHPRIVDMREFLDWVSLQRNEAAKASRRR